MAKKDTTSDWKDWILGKKKSQGEGGQPEDEPQGGQPDPSSQTLPPEAARPEEVKAQMDEILGLDPQPAPGPFPPSTPPEPGPGTQTEPPPSPSPSAPDQPQPQVAPPPRDGAAEPSVPRPSGGGRLPKEVFAHLVLLDINGEVRKARELPRFFPLKRIRTLAGRHVRAHIHLDDEATVRPEHARIFYEDRDGRTLFIIEPVGDGKVLVNDRQVYGAGAVLDNGDLIRIGSATLLFYQKNLKN
ncbi:MAG: FHA domain-containing protein [Deltaproteobacteria bacterium]|nr:MAG: FHA domain-containing protein [Deltaproteobacteria bacterium]